MPETPTQKYAANVPGTDDLCDAIDLAMGATRSLLASAHITAQTIAALGREIRRAEEAGIELPMRFEGETLSQTAEYLADYIDEDGRNRGQSSFDFDHLLEEAGNLSGLILEAIERDEEAGSDG